ncbi:hypothetical protein [Flavobacterium sp.]|uniref:hypothetical protein n=1 Tax=Flavobacterium sp. TaxID=239 RepID=UPI0039E52947
MEQCQLFWKDALIGEYEDPMPDMWYFDGKFIPNESPLAKAFMDHMANTNPQELLHDWSKGIKAAMQFGNDKPIAVVVLALDEENNLFVRRIPG